MLNSSVHGHVRCFSVISRLQPDLWLSVSAQRNISMSHPLVYRVQDTESEPPFPVSESLSSLPPFTISHPSSHDSVTLGISFFSLLSVPRCLCFFLFFPFPPFPLFHTKIFLKHSFFFKNMHTHFWMY